MKKSPPQQSVDAIENLRLSEPEKFELIQRAIAVNEVFRENGRQHLLLPVDPKAVISLAEIEKAERIALHIRADRAVPTNGSLEAMEPTERKNRVAQFFVSTAGAENTGGVLTRLIKKAREKMSEAQNAKLEAEQAAARAAEVQAQYESLESELEIVRRALLDAQQVLDSTKAALEAATTTEEFARRFTLAAGVANGQWKTVSGGLYEMERTLAAFPQVEKFHLEKIAGLEKQISELVRDHM